MIKQILLGGLFCFLIVAQSCGQPHKHSESQLKTIELVQEQATVLNNNSETLPVKNLADSKIISLNFGFSFQNHFDSLLNKYTLVDSMNVMLYRDDMSGFADKLNAYNLVIATIPDKALLETEVQNFLENLQSKKQLVIVLFGDGKYLKNLDNITAPVIWCPTKNAESASFIAQLIFGGRGVQNKLPATFSDKYTQGQGFDVFPFRLAYTVPEELNLNSNDFTDIDKIVKEAIEEKATPGAVVLVALNGKIIFNKAYGHHTYEESKPVHTEDIYDLASITKIAATTLASMKLYEEEKLNLEAPVADYIPETNHTDKANIKIKNVLTHQAGFIPYIPFYQTLKPEEFSRDSSKDFSVKVADSFYISKDYYKSVMWKRMLQAPLKTPGKYVYSDLSMYYMKEAIENITGQSLPQYLGNSFYKSLGVRTMVFNPRNKFNKMQIVPTEQDSYFRHTLLWGYVHDQGAAMAGGVSGHAGLFSNATDLAVLSQMLLNKGAYGGVEYFKPQTVDLFTAKQSDASRRGLGFDRWDPDPAKKYPSEYASEQTYGHTGYTGTCLWIDPAHDLIYIFLSNRVHPKVTNKLLNLSTRSRIQDVVYKAIERGNNKK